MLQVRPECFLPRPGILVPEEIFPPNAKWFLDTKICMPGMLTALRLVARDGGNSEVREESLATHWHLLRMQKCVKSTGQ